MNPLKQAIEAAEFCIKHTYNARMKDEDIAIWSVGTSSKPRITLQTLKVLIQAAESALKLEEALGVAEKAIQAFSDGVAWNHKKGDILLEGSDPKDYWKNHIIRSEKYEVPWKAATMLLEALSNIKSARGGG